MIDDDKQGEGVSFYVLIFSDNNKTLGRVGIKG